MGLRRFLSATVLALAAALPATPGTPLVAQDTRTVAEPRYPPICKVLYAELVGQNGTLPEKTVERHYRDNPRIEKALADCRPGQAVALHASKTGRNIFLIGPLRLRAGVTLIVDASAAVWGSRDPRNYDVKPGSCGIVGERGPGCLPLILAEDAPHAGLMGDGVIDARGGAKLLGQNETWWELAHRAKVEDSNQAVSRLLVVRRSPDFTLYRVTLRNSPNCHVTLDAQNGFTAWAVKIDTPKWARNTDGIDPQSGSSNISIVDSYIRSGDDNISPKSTASGGAVTHMTVRNVAFFNGHGFGIGSQTSGGLSAIRVDGLTIDGADNGIRIKSDKSRGGLVEDVRFDNVCMRGVANPIVLNPFYTTFDGARIPVYRNIVLHNVHSLRTGGITLAGLDPAHRLEATLDNVVIDGVKNSDITSRHAVFTLRRGNLDPQGEDVTSKGSDGGGGAYVCEGKFVQFPENNRVAASAELIPPADATFYVAADGTGDYYSVQSALNKVPATGGLVSIAPGVYRERLLVTQSHVTLRSANPDAAKTLIVFDLSHSSQATPPQGNATVRVRGDDFSAENLTFENDYGPTHKQDLKPGQTQALHLAGDRNVLKNVRVVGGDGALYVGARNCPLALNGSCELTRTLMIRSYVAGNEGFVQGDGTLYCDECELHSLDLSGGGYVTAQGRHAAGQESQFVFRRARLTGDPGVANVALGKPWRDYASVVFLNPLLSGSVATEGWREWTPGTTHRLETAFFRVYEPTGGTVAGKALSAREVGRFAPKVVLAGHDGWAPAEVK
jgi:polygalacturonase